MRKMALFPIVLIASLFGCQQVCSQNPDYSNYVIDENTYIKVCFTGTHTFVSDLGFYLVASPQNSSKTSEYIEVKLMPAIGLYSDATASIDGIPVENFGCIDPPPWQFYTCNSGNDFNNFCFSTHSNIGGAPISSIDPQYAPCVCELETPLEGLVASAGPWNPLYGINPANTNWFVQIRDCYGLDVGTLDWVSLYIGFNIDCGCHYRHFFQAGYIINENTCLFEDAPLVPLVVDLDYIHYSSGTPKICQVETSAANYNVLSWVKDYNNQFIDHYLIYRKQEPNGSYFQLSQSDYDQEPTFLDGTAQPHLYSYRYRISVIDTCGNEIQSLSHKTFLLSYTIETEGVWNLLWQNYEGVNYSDIEIYRGTNPDEMELLTTVPASATAYTDNEAPMGSYVYYQLKIVNPNNCNAQKSEGEIVSNIATNDEGYYLHQITPLIQTQFTLSPNPTSNTVFVSFDAPKAKLSICDLNGKSLIVKNDFTGGEINIGHLKAGVYVVKMETDEGIAVKKLIVQ